MKVPKNFIFDLQNDALDEKRKYDNADFSFLVNISTLGQLANAYKKSFNLFAKKEITGKILFSILVCLEKYLKIIEKLELTTINDRLDVVQESAKQLCRDHSLPVEIKDKDLEDEEEMDYRYYQNALNKSKKRTIDIIDYDDE